MNKKTLIIVSVSIILIAAASYWAYKDFFAFKAGTIGAQDTSEKIGGLNYEVATTTDNTIVSAEDDILFKKTVLEIVSMPIVFSVEASEASKEKARKAIEELNSQISGDYDHLDLLLNLGIRRQSTGDYNGAIKVWEFAGAVFPKNYASFQNIGFTQGFYLKDYGSSEENYLKSLENDPSNTQAYLDLVDIYNFSGQAGKIPEFLKANLKIAGDINRATLKTLLAKYYVDIKDYANATKYYEEVLSANPSNIDIEQELERLKSL